MRNGEGGGFDHWLTTERGHNAPYYRVWRWYFCPDHGLAGPFNSAPAGQLCGYDGCQFPVHVLLTDRPDPSIQHLNEKLERAGLLDSD